MATTTDYLYRSSSTVPDGDVTIYKNEVKNPYGELQGPTEVPDILDSGERVEFKSGAVRDIHKGKGRCDLMPIGVVANLLGDRYLLKIDEFLTKRDSIDILYDCLYTFFKETYGDLYSGILEVSKHYEGGAIKYGEHNWEKGIPLHSFFDSAIRHRIKMLRCDKDEPHDRAFAWNIMGAIWTLENKPEYIDI